MQPFPNLVAPFVDKITGYIRKPWIQYLQQFTQTPPAFVQLSVGTSPLGYTAKEPGFIIVTGGTVSDIDLVRGGIGIHLTGQVVPVSINDSVTITFSVAPTVYFIPIYGASTTNG